MLLANAIGFALLLMGWFLGIASQVVAVLIELPLLWLVTRRKGLWRWVIGANVASLLVGIRPGLALGLVQSPGEGIDPWQWYQGAWLTVLNYCIVVFILTVVVEAFVYLRMNRLSQQRIGWKKLLAATFAVNVISYAPMVAYLIYDTQDVGDYEFAPNTAWVSAPDTRAYFVDQDTNQLNSIKLDGSDRRLELETPMGRFEGEVQETCFYALLEDDPRILFVAPDRHWYVADVDGETKLNSILPYEDRWCRLREFSESLIEALKEIGEEQRIPIEDSLTFQGVFRSSSTRFDFRPRGWRGTDTFRLHSGSSPYSGAGMWGLRITNTKNDKVSRFGIWAGTLRLACNNPTVLPDENTIVFRCGNSLMVLDIAAQRVGKLVKGDSMLLKLPPFREFTY